MSRNHALVVSIDAPQSPLVAHHASSSESSHSSSSPFPFCYSPFGPAVLHLPSLPEHYFFPRSLSASSPTAKSSRRNRGLSLQQSHVDHVLEPPSTTATTADRNTDRDRDTDRDREVAGPPSLKNPGLLVFAPVPASQRSLAGHIPPILNQSVVSAVPLHRLSLESYPRSRVLFDSPSSSSSSSLLVSPLLSPSTSASVRSGGAASTTWDTRANNPYVYLRSIPVESFAEMASDLMIRDVKVRDFPWKPCFMALVENTLYLFHSNQDQMPIQVIPLGEFSVLIDDSLVKSEGKFLFVITTGASLTLLFSTDSASLRNKWIVAFRCVEVLTMQSQNAASGRLQQMRDILYRKWKDELAHLQDSCEEIVEAHGEDTLRILVKLLSH
eukprot:ANDGO_07999.mRNA.1 hypothetical protein